MQTPLAGLRTNVPLSVPDATKLLVPATGQRPRTRKERVVRHTEYAEALLFVSFNLLGKACHLRATRATAALHAKVGQKGQPSFFGDKNAMRAGAETADMTEFDSPE